LFFFGRNSFDHLVGMGKGQIELATRRAMHGVRVRSAIFKRIMSRSGSPIGRRSGDHFPLRDDWPATPIVPRKPDGNETPVTVHHTHIPSEAMLMRDQLNARGIACWIEQHQPSRLIQYQTTSADEISVIVWSADELLATELLEHLRKPRHVEKPD
jgi:hypothetical protein